jgi:hypothetical protein
VDVASYKAGLDFQRLAELGYRFVISKATEGPIRDGSTHRTALPSRGAGSQPQSLCDNGWRLALPRQEPAQYAGGPLSANQP